MDVGARIIQLRTAYGLSQYALWKRSGIAQGALSQYESGAKTPGIDTIEKLCTAFGIRLSDFFTEETTQTLSLSLSTDEAQLICYYRKLTSRQQQDVLLVFRALSKSAEEKQG